ncbi:hypothetical protein HFN01_35665 [Rhizobium leguminosarum]|nr:hypothetical protein [Rhizobium leguminosarum]MBY5516792.1 hypothetical protein [Rhizobium leguminosarum]
MSSADLLLCPRSSIRPTPIRSRISERAKTMPPSPERDDPAKIGNSIVSLTCIKDHEQTSR